MTNCTYRAKKAFPRRFEARPQEVYAARVQGFGRGWRCQPLSVIPFTTASTPTGLERDRRALDELLRHGDSVSLQGLKNTVMTVLMVVSISEVRVEGIGGTAAAAIVRQGTIAQTRRRVRSLQAGQGADQWISRTYNALRLVFRDRHHIEHP